MALEILHNRATHTHENEQFRRIAKNLMVLFDKMKWDGVLIGNPFNPEFSRFKADAILYYTNGLLIIDLKDYAGDIKLPPNSQEFRITKWYVETDKDKQRIEIKGGSRFINPFKQLEAYRYALIELIKSNLALAGNIDHTKICSVNLFSGQIQLSCPTPRDMPYYRITQESDFQSFLYDYASPIQFKEELAAELKRVFPSEPWKDTLNYMVSPNAEIQGFKFIDDDFTNIISEFIEDKDRQILILESGNSAKRDEWLRYIHDHGVEFGIPQTELWAHSNRISGRIKRRTGIEPDSLYSVIYGGVFEPDGDEKEQDEEERITDNDNADDFSEQVQEIIGFKSDSSLDDNALVVVCEAHLITRSLFQSELIRFGTGRLLEDMVRYLRLDKTNRKFICIGDPYSLSYGKEEDCALSQEAYADIYSNTIEKYRDRDGLEDKTELFNLRQSIAQSIDEGIFNQLQYHWDKNTLVEVTKSETESLFHKWFKDPINAEPEYAALVFKNKDALTINNWIRKQVQNKPANITHGDLMIANNNFNIPDEFGLSVPRKIQNGMYLRVEKVLEKVVKPITPKGKPTVNLFFQRLKVTCLSTNQPYQADIWMLENYLLNNFELTKEEQIAFRVFLNIRMVEFQRNNPFEKSEDYEQMVNSPEYKTLILEREKLNQDLESGERVKTKLSEVEKKIRKIERNAKKSFRSKVKLQLLKTDPFVNAALLQYGYAMTVHKALGTSFKEVLLNSTQDETRGVKNEGYFRWIYTGLACTTNVAKIINPISVSAMNDCVFEDTDEIKLIETDKNTLVFPEINLHDFFKQNLLEDMPENVKRGVSFFASIVQSYGYLLDVVLSKPYLAKVILTTPFGDELVEKEKLIVALNYNGQNSVTSIRIEREGKSDKAIINNCIDELRKKIIPDDIIFPTDWRQAFYERWKKQFELMGYSLLLSSEHPNQSVFFLTKQDSKARFRLWYRDNGFFSKIEIIEKSSEAISNDIKDVLLNAQ